MQTYVRRGYRVLYLTARGEGLRLLDGTTAREATEQWLEDHDFPYTSDGVFLADGVGALGGEAADYKIGVMEDLMDVGVTFAYAYGNADTDIEAFQAVGIPDDRIFLVGKLAGQMGVVPVTDAEAFDEHLPRMRDHVPCAPEPRSSSPAAR
jgi:phosphatidate phosphatase PAH1